MVVISMISFLLCLRAVQCFKIISKVALEPDHNEYYPIFNNQQRSLGSLHYDSSKFEAILTGIKQPIAVDCTLPSVICEFPLVVKVKEMESIKPSKNVEEIPIVIKGSITDDSKIENREDSEENVELIVNKDTKVPIIRGTLDIEHNIASDDKSIQDTWFLEKNTINKKYKLPVKLVPPKIHHDHTVAPIYPLHRDFHDHFSGGDPYHYNTDGHGWTPWMRAYPSVYNHPSNNPCQPPVYHYPPPCTSSVAPTNKPIIQIDDKIEKEAE